MKYMYIKVVNIKEVEVALAAPISPNLGINIIFSNVFKIAHTKLILNTILIFPMLERHDPTDTSAA